MRWMIYACSHSCSLYTTKCHLLSAIICETGRGYIYTNLSLNGLEYMCFNVMFILFFKY